MLRARCDYHGAQVLERSRARNCGDPSKEANKNGFPRCTREVATEATKLAPIVAPGELHNDLVTKAVGGKEVAIDEAHR